MKKTTLRRIGAGLTALLVTGGLTFGLPEANAAIATYTCSGATNDVAGTQFFSTFSSAQLLQNLAGAIPNFPANPVLPITIDPSVPAAVAPGNSIVTQFAFKAALPDSLITAAQGFGLTQVVVKDASFGVNVTGGTPATVTGGFATKTVPLAAGATVDHTIAGTVTPTVGAGGVVSFKAGAAKLSITLNVDVGILFAHIDTVTLNCVPNDITVAQTTIVGTGTTTTTTSTTTSTTSTTTTTVAEPTTTTTSTTSTTTTTIAEPTTTTTTTIAEPTTTTTTTTIPPGGGSDTANVRIAGDYGYQNSGAVGGAGYAVTSDQFGISSVTGSGTLPGKNGGTASVSIDVNRFLFWTFGSVTVNDPGAGINLGAPLIFAPAPAGSKAAASVSAGWFTFADGFKTYTIDLTVGDNA